MANYKWVINAVDCYTTKDGLEKVAYNVHWSYFLTEEEHSVSMIGVQSVGSPDPDNFLPFEQLTEEIVVGWIEAAMDVEKMQENLQNQLADKIAPKVVTLQLHKSYPDHFIGVDGNVGMAEQVAEPEA
jgi:hypothetical protein